MATEQTTQHAQNVDQNIPYVGGELPRVLICAVVQMINFLWRNTDYTVEYHDKIDNVYMLVVRQNGHHFYHFQMYYAGEPAVLYIQSWKWEDDLPIANAIDIADLFEANDLATNEGIERYFG